MLKQTNPAVSVLALFCCAYTTFSSTTADARRGVVDEVDVVGRSEEEEWEEECFRFGIISKASFLGFGERFTMNSTQVNISPTTTFGGPDTVKVKLIGPAAAAAEASSDG